MDWDTSVVHATVWWFEAHASSDQLGIERDLRLQELRDWTVQLSVLGQLAESRFAEIRHLGAQRESRAADAEAIAVRVKGDSGLGIEFAWGIARALQLKSERHREAAGMRGSDQLFRVRTLLVFEASLERIRGLGKHTGVGRQVAIASASGTAP